MARERLEKIGETGEGKVRKERRQRFGILECLVPPSGLFSDGHGDERQCFYERFFFFSNVVELITSH